ncbi:MAG: CoA ester lyase [Rhodospirillaceae bacterium]|jgi:citrate lyase subunit beta / citryl-CoA lyase|nr:CoA ester lyase [Rhodospirillaceae bacterium]MBT4937948.1 CoA ester lyase [Rhodospirillaceae bacterium]MBT5941561.1 CoA ester lyase [Rhodospirillaceae bacterium]MBT7268882.1 CoA ester lyase [Rhodospirillaceae bacterium]
MNQLIRSLLFVPASKEETAIRAPSRGADVIILDLEDGVPAEQKERARTNLPTLIENLEHQGAEVWLRPNALDQDGRADIDAVQTHQNPTLLLPKVTSADEVEAYAEAWFHLKATRENLSMVPTIEDAGGMFVAASIAGQPNVVGLAFGSEDFATSAGVSAEIDALAVPAQLVSLAAAANACPAYGIPDSISNYHDLERFSRAAEKARTIGYSGALCIHPAQVNIANDTFRPTEAEIEWAQSVIAQASETGAVGSTIGMIDAPILARAQNILGSIET